VLFGYDERDDLNETANGRAIALVATIDELFPLTHN
jgi:hypothetical protein